MRTIASRISSVDMLRMYRIPPALVAVAAAALLAFLVGCGSGDDPPLAHVTGVAGSPSTAQLDRWMHGMVAGDYIASIGRSAPQGLVSEPADYSECAVAAKKVVPRTSTSAPKLTNAQISQKCRQLYRAVKAQALGYLIQARWIVAEAAEEGVKVSDSLVRERFAQLRKQAYPTDAALRRYLDERQLTLPDLLFELKRNLLNEKILASFKAKVEKIGGGKKTYIKLALQRYKSMVARTKCRSGYVVPSCSEYRGPPIVVPSPNMLLEYFVAGK